MSKSILTRQQKLFRMESVCPFDANNISLDEAMAKLFIYLRTGGRKIATTSKPFYLSDEKAVPETLIDIVLDLNSQNFQGVSDAQRKELLSAWVGSHFAIMTKSRKLGEQRITGMRPLHFGIIKLFNPRVRSQDRYLSDFFFNALKDDPALASNPDSLFKQFFGVCVRPFGNTDFQIDEAEITKLAKAGGIDVELLFLLRLLEPFESDTFGLKKDERAASFSFLCPEQVALMRQDLQLLFLYKGKIPRRELNPRIDSELSFVEPTSPEFRRRFFLFENSTNTAQSRSRTDEDDLLSLYAQRPESPEERTPEKLKAAQDYVTMVRRKLFFEGRLAPESQAHRVLDALIPYDNVREFIDFIADGKDLKDKLKNSIILAISRSESIYDEQRGRENICIRTRQQGHGRVRAFYTYPASEFNLTCERANQQARYVEFLPSALRLKHASTTVCLDISLDLYETLMRIREGYVPAAGEMKAFFLNLLMFKKQLMSSPSERLLLAESDYQLCQIRRTPQNGIAMSLA